MDNKQFAQLLNICAWCDSVLCEGDTSLSSLGCMKGALFTYLHCALVLGCTEGYFTN